MADTHDFSKILSIAICSIFRNGIYISECVPELFVGTNRISITIQSNREGGKEPKNEKKKKKHQTSILLSTKCTQK